MSRARVDVFLTPGRLTVHTTPTFVKTILGSCVAVCLWTRHRRVGGINHFLLPAPAQHDIPDDRFGTIATAELIQRVLRRGVSAAEIRAAVIGGGHPVSALEAATVGDDNTSVALAVLRDHRIHVSRRETGGAHGRKLLFNTATGDLLVRPLRGWPRSQATLGAP